MSLYNQLFGENKDTTALLGMIELTRNDFDRFRDVWLNTVGTEIDVFTRLGGGNRQDYKDTIEKIRNNKFYLNDYDDNFDNTYAHFIFKVPEKYLKTCEKIAPKEPISFEKRFKQALEDMHKPGTRAFEATNNIANIIKTNIEKGNPFIGI